MIEKYTGEERRTHEWLTEEQIELIAERAATRALSKMTDQLYREVGKGVISKFLYLIGVVTVAAWAWAHNQGWAK
jgi:hypothetical protein